MTATGDDPTREVQVTLAVEALATLAQVEQSQVTTVTVVLQPPSQPVQLAMLRPTEEASGALHGIVADAADEYRDCEVINYEPSTSVMDGQVMWLPVTAVPLLQAVTPVDSANLPLFDPGKSKLTQLRFSVIHAESVQAEVIFVQALRSNQVVARSKNLGAMVRKGVIDVPKRGEFFLLRRDMAAVVTGGVVFFRNRQAFQRLFGYLDELRQQAEQTFALISADLKIEGLDAMRTAVTSSPAMLGKMASIQRKLDQYPEYREALTMPRLKAFADAHPDCEVEIVGDGDAAHFVFHGDPQRRFKILKLLDDDYLRSELTTLEYEANSKSAPLAAG
jgi:hypothetical protein